MSYRRDFVLGVIVIYFRYIMIVIEVKMAASRHLDSVYIFLIAAKLLKLTV
jgi:hypothetical protein